MKGWTRILHLGVVQDNLRLSKNVFLAKIATLLSVLLPVYCYNVNALLRALLDQLTARGDNLNWEIRIYDDGSPAGKNWPLLDDLQQQPNVVYKLLAENLGRAKIRNLLAQEAIYDNLLFLDADGDIPADFIATYLPWLGRAAVVCGGRCYDERAISPDKMLHWCYGNARESAKAKQRNQKPYEGFQTNNFLAPRAFLLRHPFEEYAQGYGHEDTLWGWQLKTLGQEIIHIDNAVVHRGLESATVFLEKQEAAVANLQRLQAIQPDLATRLSRMAARMQRLRPVLQAVLAYLAPHFKRELCSQPPGSLYYLDLLKLYWYWQ